MKYGHSLFGIVNLHRPAVIIAILATAIPTSVGAPVDTGHDIIELFTFTELIALRLNTPLVTLGSVLVPVFIRLVAKGGNEDATDDPPGWDLLTIAKPNFSYLWACEEFIQKASLGDVAVIEAAEVFIELALPGPPREDSMEQVLQEVGIHIAFEVHERASLAAVAPLPVFVVRLLAASKLLGEHVAADLLTVEATPMTLSVGFLAGAVIGSAGEEDAAEQPHKVHVIDFDFKVLELLAFEDLLEEANRAELAIVDARVMFLVLVLSVATA